MSRPLYQRRFAELQAKRTSLRHELDDWKTQTVTSPALRRHHSQIRLLDATLTGVLDAIAADMDVVAKTLATPAAAQTILEQAIRWENHILAAHSIWEFFRSKYVLRQNELFRDYLAACDDLAWACYEPALRAFTPGTPKEPPLVFLSATWSPFAQARDSNFQNEVRVSGGSREALADEPFQQILRQLPVPLLSLPWYETFHLPAAVLLAHEVGHLVELEFNLSDDLANTLQRANLQAPEVWRGWRAEVFADVYGCLAMGPAFVGALMDLLTIAPATLAKEHRRAGTHPTRAVRVQLLLTVLSRMGYAEDSQRLQATWKSTYPTSECPADLAPDIEPVVHALLTGPFRGIPLTQVITLPPTDSVRKIARFAGQGARKSLEVYTDPRYLLAAAQSLHEEPVPNQSKDAFKLLVDQALRRGHNQFRNAGVPVLELAELDTALRPREKQARQDGARLCDHLFR